MKISKLIAMGLSVVALTALGYVLASWFLGKPDEFAQSNTQLEKTLAELSAESDTYAVGERLAGEKTQNTAAFDPAFPELQWDDLMPADWDPMAAFRDLNIAELQDDDPKAQQALDAMRKAWNDAPVNLEIADKKVRIPGFAIPIEQSEQGVDEFLLVPYFGACIHTPPPPANQIIHVKLSEPQPTVGSMQPYWVWGELTASKFSSELGDAAYLINATGIRPYEE